jgi:hypothetical protein
MRYDDRAYLMTAMFTGAEAVAWYMVHMWVYDGRNDSPRREGIPKRNICQQMFARKTEPSSCSKQQRLQPSSSVNNAQTIYRRRTH